MTRQIGTACRVLGAILAVSLCATTSIGSAQAKAPIVKASPSKLAKAGVKQRRVVKRSKRKARASSQRRSKQRARKVRFARPSAGQVFGLHRTPDPLALRSAVALVSHQGTGNTLLDKNGSVVLPIASITKLMTAMVTLDAGLPGDEMLRITRADIDRKLGSASRLSVGTRLSRRQLLQLALMSSENRAASALGRHYPGGLKAFVSAMNAKARLIGMYDTRFVEPTGLSGANVANARDLVRLLQAAFEYPQIRRGSTAASLVVDTGYRRLTFRNTNSLINASDGWQISLQKTGYISEAGRCLVMVTQIRSEPLVMVLLDSAGSQSRFGDARRIRRWLVNKHPVFASRPDKAIGQISSAGQATSSGS